MVGEAAFGGVVDSVIAIIVEVPAGGEEVRIAGFGTIGIRSIAARSVRSPRTGEAVGIPAPRSPMFKAGEVLRDAVNAGARLGP